VAVVTGREVRQLVEAVPGATLNAVHHPEGRAESIREGHLIVARILSAIVPELSKERASEADTAVLLLVFDNYRGRCMLENGKIDIPIDRLPLLFTLVLCSFMTEVKVPDTRWHSIHWKVAGLSEGVRKTSLEGVDGSALDALDLLEDTCWVEAIEELIGRKR
jgi:hypothetical protein